MSDPTTPTPEQRAATEQPPPQPNANCSIWRLVIEDMQARDKLGRQRYGTPLQAHNGRDALTDAYQEALDLCVYLRQAIAERDDSASQSARRSLLADIAAQMEFEAEMMDESVRTLPAVLVPQHYLREKAALLRQWATRIRDRGEGR